MEMTGLQIAFPGENHGSFQDIAQFTGIAGQSWRLSRVIDSASMPVTWQWWRSFHLPHHGFAQGRDVFAAVPQGRQA